MGSWVALALCSQCPLMRYITPGGFVFWRNPGLVKIPDVLVLDVVMVNYVMYLLEEAARLINRK